MNELVRKAYIPKKYVHLQCGTIFPSVAYVDDKTLKGIDSNNEPIQLAWEDSRGRFIEIEGETK